MKKLTILFTLLVILTGCKDISQSPVIRVEPIGKIISATPLATSFNESEKTNVITNTYSVNVYGYPSIKLNAEAQIVTTTNGRYLQWSGMQSDELSPIICIY